MAEEKLQSFAAKKNKDGFIAQSAASCLEEGAFVAVLLGGVAPQRGELLQMIKKAACCIAADRGADLAMRASRAPELLIGDMDSLSREALFWCEKQGAQKEVHPAEKDETDGELAVRRAAFYAKKNKLPAVCFFGATGGRADHFLANLYLGKLLLEQGLEVFFLDDELTAYLIKGKASLELTEKRGRLISLLPFFGEAGGVSLTGFRYLLQNARLKAGAVIGISNELMTEEGRISLAEGYLLVLQNRP